MYFSSLCTWQAFYFHFGKLFGFTSQFVPSIDVKSVVVGVTNRESEHCFWFLFTFIWILFCILQTPYNNIWFWTYGSRVYFVAFTHMSPYVTLWLSCHYILELTSILSQSWPSMVDWQGIQNIYYYCYNYSRLNVNWAIKCDQLKVGHMPPTRIIQS